jgi:hypothetical protein
MDLSLPPGSMFNLSADPELPPFPKPPDPFQLQGFVDTAHANDLRSRRSTTGFAFCLANAAVVYRYKTQSITSTSSTEAEFLAVVTAAKTARYLRSILQKLGFEQPQPTM